MALQWIASAHEFWLQPQRYRVSVGQEFSIKFLVGENFEGEPWVLKPEKVEKLEWHSLKGMQTITKQINYQGPKNLSLKFPAEGTQLLYFQSKDSFIELEGEKFNAYLKEDGLDDILELRTKNNQLDQPAREHYGRYAKVLMQTGSQTDDTYKKKVGARLEIIPLKNPYALQTGDYLTCQLLFEGKPAAHRMLKVWNKIDGKTFLQNIYSEKDGTITFPLNAKGVWMVSTVRMIPSDRPESDWKSMWASLTFGIE